VADNLSFDITADSTKARADLALIESSLRKARRELKSFADEANKTGDTTKLTKVTQEIQRTEKAYASLKKEVHSTKKENEGFLESLSHAAHGNRPIARLAREFGNLGGSIENASVILGRFAGGFAGGLAALAAFKGFEILKDTVGEANKALGELKKTAGEIGVRPVALKAVQVAAAEAGHEVDAATKVYEGFAKVIEENRNKFATPVVGGAGLPTVLSGGTLGTPTPGVVSFPGAQGAGGRNVRVGRGGAPGLTDPTKALDDLDLSRFEKTEEGVEKAARALQARVLELQKTMNSVDFNIFAKAKFGVSGTVLGEIANDMEAMEKIARRLVGPLNAAAKQLEELAAARGKLNTVREQATAPAVSFFNQADIAIMTALTHFFEAPWKEKFSELWAGVTDDWSSFWAEMARIAAAGAQQIAAILGGLARARAAVSTGLADPGSNIAEPFGGGISGAIGGALPADYSSDTGGFARGGFVRGPGSGTSDSILARLSAGEFVVNSARVRQVGLGFLQRLNGFADGGFVGPGPLRFATGGLVPSAGGGRAVHLHLGSSSFALSGHDSVVEALVSAAHSQQIRSAGVKPSWFAARPGG
jgi:hypothetical protein